MGDIRFSCRACAQHLAIDASDTGTEIDCPVCGVRQTVPMPQPQQPQEKPAPVDVAPALEPTAGSLSTTATADYRYWAFISYSSKDKAWGRWLHHAIETYGIPTEFVKRHVTPIGHQAPKRFHPIFRDRDELPASADLGAVIRASLQASRYLIVICSPNSARSFWVNAEIETFLALGRRDRILAVIVDGEPNTGDDRECFPPALRRFEPIAADARPSGDGKTNAKLKLLAGMLGVNFDSLKQRDKQRRRRRFVLTTCAAILLIALVAVPLLSLVAKERGKGAWRRYAADMTKVQGAWEQGDITGMLALLDAQYPQRVGGTDYRGWEWYYWLAQTHGEYRTFTTSKSYFDSTLNSLWFSPDGKRLMTGSMDGKVKTWDIGSGKEISSVEFKGATDEDARKRQRVPPGHRSGEVNTLISPDGRLVATSSLLCNTVQVWDAGSGRNIITLTEVAKRSVKTWDSKSKATAMVEKDTETPVSCVAFSPDGKRLATGGIDCVNIWDIQSGKGGHVLLLEADMGGTVSSVCFSPDGQRVAAGGVGATAAIFDGSSGKLLHSLTPYTGARKYKGNDAYLGCVTFSPDGKRLAAGSSDGKMFVWDANSGTNVLAVKAHDQYIDSVAFSPDGQQLATGSGDQSVKVWDAKTGKEVFTPKGHENSIDQVLFSPDGRLLASCDVGGVVKIWRGLIVKPPPLTVGTGPVCISPNGKRLAAADADKVRVWDIERGKEIFSFNVVGPMGALCFSADGNLLAVGGYGVNDVDELTEGMTSAKRPTQIWDAATGNKRFTIVDDQLDEDEVVSSISFSPDGKTIVIYGAGACVYDVASGRNQRFLTGARGQVPQGSVCFSPDGRMLAVGGRLYDARSGVDIGEFGDGPFQHGEFDGTAFSPDGKRFAWEDTSSGEGDIFDTTSRKKISTFIGSLPCFSPDGKRLAAAASAGVKLYATEDGQDLLTLRGLKAEVSSIAFTPDGRRLLVGCVDGTIQTWDAATDE